MDRANAIASVVSHLCRPDESANLSVHRRADSVLIEAGTLLASALEYEPTLRRVAGLTVPALADLCVIYMHTPAEDGGEVRRAAQVFRPHAVLPHGDLPHAELQHTELQHTELQRPVLPHGDLPHAAVIDHAEPRKVSRLRPENPVAIALRTGKTVWIHDVHDHDLVEAAADEGELAELRAACPRSLLCLPLAARGRVIGTLLLGSERLYDDADVEIAEALALRAAWALDSALVHAATEAARQRSEEARLAAESANRVKDTFLATLSHELRTPMAALLLWEDILRNAKDESMRVRALNAIHESAQAQSKLIEDLLDVSRCMSGKLLIESTVVSIGSVIERALEVAVPMARAKGVRLERFYHRALGCVMGDASRLRQVLGNLLSNAIKFTDRGGMVEVRAERVGTRVELSVRDTGSGISPDFLPEVFTPFQQAASGLPRTQVGLGLGLAIVRQLVEMHDGTVRAHSAGLGRGSTFTVTLPTLGARPPAAISGVAAEPKRRNPAARSGVASRALRGLRILVVDDEPAVLEALALVLRAEGCEVAKTRSTLQALAALRRGHWDVLISDIAMPGDDGYSLIRRLRTLTSVNRRHLPAIALTAHARPQDETQAIDAGFDVHLPKPVEAHDLVEAIASIVGRRSLSFHAFNVVRPKSGPSPRVARADAHRPDSEATPTPHPHKRPD